MLTASNLAALNSSAFKIGVDLMRRIGLAITSGSLQEVLDEIISSACQLVGAKMGHILLVEESGEYIYPAAWYGEARRDDLDPQIKIGEQGVTSWVAYHKRPARITDVHAAEWQSIYLEAVPGVQSELAVPILNEQGTLVGVINLESQILNAFSADDERLLVTLAEQAYIAIRNKRQFAAEERKTMLLQVAAQVAREATAEPRLDNLLNNVVNLVHDRFGFHHASIYLLDEQCDYAILRATIETGSALLDRKLRIGQEGIVGHVASVGQPHIAPDVEADPWYCRGLPETRSEMALPLRLGQKVIGVLDVQSRQVNAFPEDDVVALQILADQLAVAIENARLFEAELRARQVWKILNEVDRLIMTESVTAADRAGTLEKALQLTLDHGLAAIGAPTGSILLYDEVRGDLYTAVVSQSAPAEHKGRRLRLNEGVIGKAAREQQTQRVADVTVPAWEAIYLPLVPDTRSELAVPLLRGERLVGVFNAESPKLRAFGLADQALLESLAQQAVIAYQTLERYQTHQTLREINQLLTSSHDPEEVIQLLLRHACAFLHADWGNLRLYDGAGNPTLDYTVGGSATELSPNIQVTDWRQVTDLQRVKPEVWVREGLVARVAQEREPYLSKGDVQKDPEFRNVPGLDIHSEMAVPLLVGEELVGVLNLESERVDAFDVEDLARLLDFAVPAAVAVRDARGAEERQQARERFKALKEVGEQIINAPLDEEKILEIVLGAGLERTGAFYAVAWQLDNEGKQLEARLVQSIKQSAVPHPPIPLGEKVEDQIALNGQVAVERRPILIDDIDNLPEGIKYRRSNTAEKSSLVVPLIVGDEYYGNIDFRHKEKAGFKAIEIELIKGLAVQAASGIKRVSQHTELQKAYDKLAMADHQRFEFLAIASHELRQPLTHVNHILEQTLAGEYGELMEGVLRHRLTLAHTQAHQLVELVRRLMNVARLEANADIEKLEVSPCDVIGLIRTSIQAVQSEAQRYGISVKLEALPRDALIVDLDSVKIKETLDNLLDNAIKYNKPDGSITVACFCKDREIEMRVSDTGRGIPPDKLDRIFEWFYQVDPSRTPSIRTRSIEGLGIGLYIVRTNVKLHKGRIAVVSEVGRGSTFSVFLPMNTLNTRSTHFNATKSQAATY